MFGLRAISNVRGGQKACEKGAQPAPKQTAGLFPEDVLRARKPFRPARVQNHWPDRSLAMILTGGGPLCGVPRTDGSPDGPQLIFDPSFFGQRDAPVKPNPPHLGATFGHTLLVKKYPKKSAEITDCRCSRQNPKKSKIRIAVAAGKI